MSQQTRISPKLKWLGPYLEIGIELLPKGKSVSRLGHWSVSNKVVGKSCHAAIYTDDWKVYRIWMRTERHPRGEPVLPQSKIDLLSYLAHELAHTIDMEHTPKHKRLEAKITAAFMIQLQKDGYISEEKELA